MIGPESVTSTNHFTAQVRDCVFLGDYLRVEVEAKGTKLLIHSDFPLDVGEQVELAWSAEKLLCLPA